MDQASLLRDLMKKDLGKTIPSQAVISSSGIGDEKECVDWYAKQFVEFTHKRIGLIGWGGTSSNEWRNVRHYGFSLQQMDRSTREERECLADQLKEVEGQSDLLVFKAGSGVDALAVNLSLLADQVIYIMRPGSKSVVELAMYTKVLSKLHRNNRMSLIIDGAYTDVLAKEMKNLQDLCWNQFKYYIEPVAYLSNEPCAMEPSTLERLGKDVCEENLSSRLKNLVI